ncbi:MAG: DUF2264 domain-containing protein [Marinifilaceae bacterium]
MSNKFFQFIISCCLVMSAFASPLYGKAKAKTKDIDPRTYWCETLYKISFPVLDALSKQQLVETMPVEVRSGDGKGRANYTYLEALGRTLCGLSSWLELPKDDTKEGKMREELLQLSHKAIRNAVDPTSKDYMNFTKPSQPLVDAAFLAQAFMRSPNRLWGELDEETKQMTLKSLRDTRVIKPFLSNWLLFSATIEAFFLSLNEQYDGMRIDYALTKHKDWYKGDGVYGDGPDFHWDYYNSFVIQPMLVDIYSAMYKKKRCSEDSYKTVMKRAIRYAQVQERFIAPDGTFPPIGRSLAYRAGCMQTLAQIALFEKLPADVKPAQVRGALTAVMKRFFDNPNTFDENGWLRLGFVGHQPGIAEGYISTGSLYLTSIGFLPLGLPATAAFWSDADEPWTSVKAWGGEAFPIDHAH